MLAFTGWTSIGNSNWYIFCILWLYFFTFIAFRVYPTNYKKATVGIGILSLLYMAVMSIPMLGKDTWWYDTALCYFGGIYFSLYREKIENWLQENWKVWLLGLFIFTVGFIATYFHKEYFLLYQIQIACFVAVCVLFTMRFVIDSCILRWMGENLFEIYILQRLPMIILEPYIHTAPNANIAQYFYVIMCFIITIIISAIYKYSIRKWVDYFIKKLIYM